jgi:hypothetical protein
MVTGAGAELRRVGASVQIVRYNNSPVGPYDELIYAPGAFHYPGGEKPRLQITRIYVSSEASAYNGRKNWNIPKHLARFSFEPQTNDDTTVKVNVYPPKPGSPPFFSALLKTYRFPPPVQFDLGRIPFADLTLVQPPLPANETDPALAGTETWKSVLPGLKGRIALTSVKPGGVIRDEKGRLQYGDGIGFPQMSMGLKWLDGMVLDFPEPEEV